MTTASGVVNREDLRSYVERLPADTNFNPRFSELGDFTHLTKLEITADDVRSIARHSLFDSNSRRAFIVRDDASEELAEIYAILREAAGERGIRVFRTLEEGVDWIVPRVVSY